MSLNSPLQIINTVVTPQAVQNADQVGNTSNIYKVTGTFTTTSTTDTTPIAVTTLNGSQQLSLPVNCIPVGSILTNVGANADTIAPNNYLSVIISPTGSTTTNVIFPPIGSGPLTAGVVLTSKCGAATAFNAVTTNIAKNVWAYLDATGAVTGTFNITIFYTM
jgi:hypothetical protein